jgi:predicted peptidase
MNYPKIYFRETLLYLLKKMKTSLKLFLTFFLSAFLSSSVMSQSKLKIIKIQKETDTLATKARISKITSIDNAIFEKQKFDGKTKINYRLLSPKAVKPNEKFPLVIVFHGSGSIGNDNTKQLGVLAKLWAQPIVQKNYPAYVMAPQFPTRSSNYTNDSKRNVLGSAPQTCLETIFQLIDSLKQSLPIDRKRIYIIGFSMGGSTVINSLILKPDIFAAGISISGIPQFNHEKTLTTIPIWLIHGNNDTDNPIDSDLQLYKEISINSKMVFWEVENTNHNDIFSAPILGDAIPKWLFLHHK